MRFGRGAVAKVTTQDCRFIHVSFKWAVDPCLWRRKGKGGRFQRVAVGYCYRGMFEWLPSLQNAVLCVRASSPCSCSVCSSPTFLQLFLPFRQAANAPLCASHTGFPQQSADAALCRKTTGPSSSSELESARFSALWFALPCALPYLFNSVARSHPDCFHSSVRTGVSDDTHSSGRV